MSMTLVHSTFPRTLNINGLDGTNSKCGQSLSPSLNQIDIPWYETGAYTFSRSCHQPPPVFAWLTTDPLAGPGEITATATCTDLDENHHDLSCTFVVVVSGSFKDRGVYLTACFGTIKFKYVYM